MPPAADSVPVTLFPTGAPALTSEPGSSGSRCSPPAMPTSEATTGEEGLERILPSIVGEELPHASPLGFGYVMVSSPFFTGCPLESHVHSSST